MSESERTSQRDPLWIRLGCLAAALGAGLMGMFCTGVVSLSMLVEAPGHFVFAVMLATAFTVPYSLLLRWLDRNEPEPIWLLVLAFAWGAVVATTISGVVNDTAGSLFSVAVGPELAGYLAASLSAPVAEETTKAMALFVLVVAFRHHFDNVLDGIVYGAFIGLGFAWFENIFYYVRFGADEGVIGMIKLAWVRGFLNGIASHAAYTGLVGLGVGVWRVMRSGVVRWFVPPFMLGVAMVAHFMWNAFGGFIVMLSSSSELAEYALGVPLAVAILQAPFVLMLIAISVVALRHEDGLIRLFLEDEGSDVLPNHLRGQLAPARVRFVNGWSRLLKRGPGHWYRTRRQERLLIELAFAKWHHKRGDHAWHIDDDADVKRLRTRLIAFSNSAT